MATSFQALREKSESKAPEKTTAADDAHALGVGKAPLGSDEEELDQADSNTRNAEDESAEDMLVTAFPNRYIKREDGTYSLNTEEALRTNANITENVVDDLKKIVSQHQASKVKFADGKSQVVDATTANALMMVYGMLNVNNQVQMAARLAKNKAGFSKMSAFAFKQLKLSSGAPGDAAKIGKVPR